MMNHAINKAGQSQNFVGCDNAHLPFEQWSCGNDVLGDVWWILSL
jgi:hypothetical protein